MATKSELEAKIAKAKANSLMPEALKVKYIADIQKKIDALPGAKAEPKKEEKPAKEHQRYKIKWFNSKAKPQRIEEIVFDGEDAYEKAVAWGKKNLERFNTDVIQSTTDYPSVAQMTEKPTSKPASGLKSAAKGDKVFDTKKEKWATVRKKSKPAKGSSLESEAFIIDITYEDGKKAMNMPASQFSIVDGGGNAHPERMEKEFGKEFMESEDKGSLKTYPKKEKKAEPKKAEPAKPAGKKGVDYDCDELIEKEKARKASAQKSAAKSPAKKSGDAIEKTTDAIEKKAEDGDLTKDQILALIQKFKKEIRRLEKLLKTAK